MKVFGNEPAGMSQHQTELIGFRSVAIYFLAFLIAGGVSPTLRLIGLTNPAWGILGALLGAVAGAYETRRIGKRIERAKAEAGMMAADGFFG